MSDPSSVPPGWYDDPEAPGRPRWWNGREWGAPAVPAALGYGYGTKSPVDVPGEARIARTARVLQLVNIGAAVVSVFSIVAIGSWYGDFVRDLMDQTSQPAGRRSGTLTMDPMSGGVLAASGVNQIASLVTLAALITLLVWLYRAAVNAKGLGLPARRSPGWAVGSFFIPIVNFWFPYQSACDLFPPDHPARRMVLRWWLGYLGSSFALSAAMVTAFFSVPAALAVAAVSAGIAVLAGLSARDMIDQAVAVHSELAAGQGFATAAGPAGSSIPPPAVGSAAPGPSSPGGYPPVQGYPGSLGYPPAGPSPASGTDPWAAPGPPPKDPWSAS